MKIRRILDRDTADAMYAGSIDARFQLGATHLVAGSTGSGKTTSVIEILRNISDLFVDGEKIKNVVFYFASWQDAYADLEKDKIVTKWVQQMPTNDDFIADVQPFKNDGGSVVVIDDFMSEINKDMVDIVTVSARHNKASTFFPFPELVSHGQAGETDLSECQVHLGFQESQRELAVCSPGEADPAAELPVDGQRLPRGHQAPVLVHPLGPHAGHAGLRQDQESRPSLSKTHEGLVQQRQPAFKVAATPH